MAKEPQDKTETQRTIDEALQLRKEMGLPSKTDDELRAEFNKENLTPEQRAERRERIIEEAEKLRKTAVEKYTGDDKTPPPRGL